MTKFCGHTDDATGRGIPLDSGTQHHLSLQPLLCTYLSLFYLLQFNLGLYLCHKLTTNLPTTENSSPGRSLKLTTRLQVNLSLQI